MDASSDEPGQTRRAVVAGFGLRLFSSAPDAERVRRPTDWMLLAVSGLGVALAAFARDSFSELSDGVTAFFVAMPGLLGWFWQLTYAGLLIWSVVLLVAPVIARQRLALLRDQLLSLVLASGLALVLLEEGTFWDALFSSGAPARFPSIRVALAAAVIVVSSPHLSRPLKRLGRWEVGLGAGAAVALGVSLPMGVLGGLMIGLCTAALVHLSFGSPGGQPSLDQVAAGLEELGVRATDLVHHGLATRGAALLSARDQEGDLDIKAFGRDAWGGQLMAKGWDAFFYKDPAPEAAAGPREQVQGEAFVTLMAERCGVPVLPIVAAGMTSDDDALLVARVAGTSLGEAPSEVLTDRFLDLLWQARQAMADAKIAHGQLDEEHLVVLADGSPAFRRFSQSTTAAPPQLLMRDRAQLLVSTCLLAGEERAVAAAIRSFGKEGLGEVVPYLQTVAMSAATRDALKGGHLKQLRQTVAEAAGIETPKLEPLRRVTWGSVAMLLLILLAAYLVMSAVADIGLDAIVEELAKADQGWLWASLVVGAFAQVGQAFSTMGAALIPIRFRASYALQLAVQFIQLAVPSTAGRVAVLVRFFQKNGATATDALVIGGIDGASSFIIQVVVLLAVIISGGFTPDPSLDPSSSETTGATSGSSPIVVALVVLAVVGVAVIVAVPRFRHLIKERAVSARAQLKVLRSPRKMLMLFGGNLTAQLFLAAALGMCLRAFGYHLPLVELLFINTLVSLFAGFMPVPGAIGVAEAAYATALTAAGVPSSVAFSTALTYRMMTFYLPPLWGSVATRWLRRQDYL